MRLSDFDFSLPAERIALRPASPRDAARLLLVEREGTFQDRFVRDIPGLLDPGDALVLNRTKVIAAALRGVRSRPGGGAAQISINLNRRLTASRWSAFARPAKRLCVGDRIAFGQTDGSVCLLGVLDATVAARGEGGEVELAFDFAGPDLDLAIAERGEPPLPHYIASRRAPDARDRRDYQTVFARDEGSVAAPTAGLHFTDTLIDAVRTRGVEVLFVTLHVGAGTFLPVKTETIEAHRMWPEFGEIDAVTANRLNSVHAQGGRVVCVGTTSLRLLESAAAPNGEICAFAGDTDLFIRPGYAFKIADGLMTNFHLPKSTLFMLVAAFSGLAHVRAAYAHALEGGYRFYSYGDACLLWRR